MSKPNFLFICTFNHTRSITAESLFWQDERFVVKSAGTAPLGQSRIQISRGMLNWASHIFVMEPVHGRYLMNTFPDLFPDKTQYNHFPSPPEYVKMSRGKRLYLLNIEDNFHPHETELENLINKNINLITETIL
jgi:predicted protein tyrosine phosphatase